jgi:hypothetical protein
MARREHPHPGGDRPGAKRRAPPAHSAVDGFGRGSPAGAGRSHPGATRLRKLIVNAIDALRGVPERARAFMPRGRSGERPARRRSGGEAAPTASLAWRRTASRPIRRDDMPTPVEKFRHCLCRLCGRPPQRSSPAGKTCGSTPGGKGTGLGPAWAQKLRQQQWWTTVRSF